MSIPAAMIGLKAGALALGALALLNPGFRTIDHNPLRVGSLPGSILDMATVLGVRWKLAGRLSAIDLLALLTPPSRWPRCSRLTR